MDLGEKEVVVGIHLEVYGEVKEVWGSWCGIDFEVDRESRF